MTQSRLLSLLVVGAVGVAVFQNWPAIKNVAAGAGIDLAGAIGGFKPGMRLDPSARDVIEDRRGGPMGDLGPASFPGGGFGRGRYADGERPITPLPNDDGYQGRQGGSPPPMPSPPCPPGCRSHRRPVPGGAVDDGSDWWDDRHFGPERNGRRWRDCGASGGRCGPWVNGPMPGDPIHEDERWRR